MNVCFAGKSFNAQQLTGYISQCEPKDVIVFAGVLFEVETVQKSCIDLDGHYFTNCILRREDGTPFYTRDLFGKVEIYRRQK